MSSERVERVIELTKQLLELDRRRDLILGQIDALVSPGLVTSSDGPGLVRDPMAAPATIGSQVIPGSAVLRAPINKPEPATAVLVSPEPRTLVGVARFGFSKEVYDFMKMHPDHEFSPEEVAKRLNRPEKRGLASTALSRLFHQGDVERTQIGRYIYRSSRPLNFSKEAQSNGAPR